MCELVHVYHWLILWCVISTDEHDSRLLSQINENVNVDLWDTIKDYFNNEEVKNTKEPKINQKNMKLRIKKNHNNKSHLKLSKSMSNDPIVFMAKINKYNVILDINKLNVIITKYYPNYDFLHILKFNYLEPHQFKSSKDGNE